MATTSAQETVVSAPGKVLIAGGYLVLEPAYPGLVIATTARFYSVIKPASSTSSASSSSSNGKGGRIQVHAPQFIGARWEYVVSVTDERCNVEQSRESFTAPEAGSNPFVGLAVLYALRLALEATSAEQVESTLANGIDIYVVADNDFYSQRNEQGAAPSATELQAKPPFNAQGCTIRNVHKTGLGSSAAMTTSLVGALLLHFGVVHVDRSTGSLVGEEEALSLVHNTAQLAHCAAQGKVGSGFDVSAAVWGSQLYRRFDKRAIQEVLETSERVTVEGESDTVGKSKYIELAPFLDPRNPFWHPSPLSEKGSSGNPTAVEGMSNVHADSAGAVARPAPIELPPHVELMLADVDSGSNTPSMVGKILAWRKEKPEWAQQMWTVLASGNQTLADGLLALRLAHAQDSVAYDEAVRLAAQHFSREWDTLAKTHPSTTLSLLVQVRNAMRSIQGGLRELGRQANVPVEPNEMGDVIKATVDGAHGVIGGGVPGAGGYDALFVLILQQEEASSSSSSSTAQREVEGVWSHWRALSVGPLLSRAGGSVGVRTSVEQIQEALLVQGAPSSLPTLPQSKVGSGGLRVHTLDSVSGLRSAIERTQ